MVQEPAPASPASARTLPGVSERLKRQLRWLVRGLSALSPALCAQVVLHLLLRPRRRRVDARDARFLSTARSHQLRCGASLLHVYEWDGEGPTVLVVHGWTSHAARLSAVIEALRRRGHRVVAFDAPAHGRSGGRYADLPAFREALQAVAATSGPVCGLIAHSFGALSAATWLAEAPLDSLRAAVLVGLPRDFGYLFESYVEVLALPPRVAARVRELFCNRYGAQPQAFSARALARHIRIPVLLVHGGADELIPASHADEVAEELLDGQVLVVGGLSHSDPLDDAGTVEAMAAFVGGEFGR